MRNHFLLILLAFFSFTCFSQEYLLDVENLNTEDGLANMYTFSTFKDSKGYLWVSTKYGLNRYDGYECELFTKEQNKLFSNSHIGRMEEDAEGNLWIFYFIVKGNIYLEAIDVFNPETGIAIPLKEYIADEIPFEIKDVTLPLARIAQKNIWIYNSNGQLFLFKTTHK